MQTTKSLPFQTMKRENMLIEPDELLEKFGNENIRIYDASVSAVQYLQGHIPGAAFFDHEKFSNPNGKYMYTILPETELEIQIGDTGISNDAEVVFYAWGMLPFAARAWWILRYAGHNNVRVLNGGITAWKDAGGTLEKEAWIYKPSIFEGNFRPDMFADKDAVLGAMNDADVSIENVLPFASYEAAHITGSTCLPCMDLMQGMDVLLSDDQLALRLKEATGYKRIITYCGGGIAAAVNAMAHRMVGRQNVAVYDGSMDEWVGEGLPLTGNGKWAIWKMK
jgi:thiosulfate/3-mercaptopyruvate sulfurtransferase